MLRCQNQFFLFAAIHRYSGPAKTAIATEPDFYKNQVFPVPPDDVDFTKTTVEVARYYFEPLGAQPLDRLVLSELPPLPGSLRSG